jgi:hypothetical protein
MLTKKTVPHTKNVVKTRSRFFQRHIMLSILKKLADFAEGYTGDELDNNSHCIRLG